MFDPDGKVESAVTLIAAIGAIVWAALIFGSIVANLITN